MSKDLDTIFIATLSSKDRGIKDRSLSRAAFLEAIVRVAIAKFIRGNYSIRMGGGGNETILLFLLFFCSFVLFAYVSFVVQFIYLISCKNKQNLDGQTQSESVALQKLLTEHIFAYAERALASEFRYNVLYFEQVDQIFKKNMTSLKVCVYLKKKKKIHLQFFIDTKLDSNFFVFVLTLSIISSISFALYTIILVSKPYSYCDL